MGIDARMVLRVKDKPSDKQLKEWSWRLAAAVGAEKLWLDKAEGRGAITLSYDYDEAGERVYNGKSYAQDGDPLIVTSYWLLEVHVSTRFYGIGYERGDLLGLCAVAEWCEQNINGCEVWYGGDSSGVMAQPWPEAARRALRQHLYSDEGREYFRHGERPNSFPHPELCSLCVSSEGFNRYGWGGGDTYVAVSCPGCGESFQSRDGGKTWKKDERNV